MKLLLVGPVRYVGVVICLLLLDIPTFLVAAGLFSDPDTYTTSSRLGSLLILLDPVH